MGRLGRIGIRIGNAVLFVLCCYLSANVLNRISASALTPARAAERAPGDGPAPVVPTWSDRRVILDRNLFGAQLAGAPPAPVEPEEKLEETKLPLRLMGTAAAEDLAVSSAAIQDEGSKLIEVVGIGDHLEKYQRVRVVGIERKRVILENGGKREELVLDEDTAKPAPPRRRAAARRPQRSSARLSNRLRELRKQAANKEPAPARNPASLFSDARILPKYENGAMVGIQLNAIKQGSLYERFGFEEGDVITSLNGIKIDNPAASARLLSELTEADDFVFEKIGRSGPEKFTVSADQVAEILGEL